MRNNKSKNLATKESSKILIIKEKLPPISQWVKEYKEKFKDSKFFTFASIDKAIIFFKKNKKDIGLIFIDLNDTVGIKETMEKFNKAGYSNPMMCTR